MLCILLFQLLNMCFGEQYMDPCHTTIAYDRNALYSIGKSLKYTGNTVSSDIALTVNELNIKKTRGYVSKTTDFRKSTYQNSLISLGIETRISKERKGKKVIDRTKTDNNNVNLIQIDCHNNKTVLEKTNFAVLNARSIRSNCDLISSFMISEKPDIAFITETWAKESDNEFYFKEITPSGYEFFHRDRENNIGGGVALILKSEFKARRIHVDDFTSFESLGITVSSSESTVRLFVIYRPPSSPFQQFFDEFSKLLESLSRSSVPFIIAGDFNIHVDNTQNSSASKFLNILASFNLNQHVTESTHVAGHTLDLIISHADDPISLDRPIIGDLISDHYVVKCAVSIIKPTVPLKVTKVRNFKELDLDSFKTELQKSELITNPSSDLNGLVDQYNDCLAELLDKYAPRTERRVRLVNRQQWYTNEIHKAKQQKRALARKYRKSRTQRDFNRLINQRDNLKTLISTAKCKYISNTIEAVKHNQKVLYQKFNSILHRTKENPMPETKTQSEVCNSLGNYFITKIDDIRSSFVDSEECYIYDGLKIDCSFSKFHELTESEVEKLIKSSSNKSCNLDPIPTALLKECISELTPILTKIVNLSLISARFPDALKHATVTPLLKKQNLERIPKNYRPVSNLPFLGKLLEQATINQLDSYFQDNDLFDDHQSAYRTGHSTETALLKITNDILLELDQNNIVYLALLDLSSAFDTVDHTILRERLSLSQGIGSDALNWIETYLADRTQSVSALGYESNSAVLSCGVPQGSKFGPKLYRKYIEPLSNLLLELMIRYHFYADDGQLFKAANPRSQDNLNDSLSYLEHALKLVSRWMYLNKLKLNEQKTEFLVIGSKQSLSKVPINNIRVGTESVKKTKTARNLGVMIDDTMSFLAQINSVVKSCRFHLRGMWKIRRYLSEDTAKTLAHSMIMSRIDYCNSLYINMPAYAIEQLQKVQNEAARFVTRTPRHESITPILIKLHWLPVRERILFKVLTIVYLAVNGSAPKYIKDMFQVHKPVRLLRSSTELRLKEKRYRLKSAGFRAFSIAAPPLWNSIPNTIRAQNSIYQFKKCLKTYLFKRAYFSI